jgi:TfoX/Sxy family transcriptional regulator of competence genes
MEIPKPTEADKEFFRSLIPDDPAVEVKPMFGNLGAFVHGNMFAGLFGPAVGVRLDEAASKELAVIDGSGPFGPAERPMGGYLSLPAAWRASPGLAAGWVERALSHVSTLPPKARRARKPKRAS